MLIYNYLPDPVGGAENQCRLQAHALTQMGQPCVILTSRKNRMAPWKEIDGNVLVVRLPVADLLFRSRFTRKQIGSCKISDIKPDSSSDKTSNFRKNLGKTAAQILKAVNTFSFAIGVTLWIAFHRQKIRLLHTHVADWNAGLSGWLGAVFSMPVVCKASFFPVFPSLSGLPLNRFWKRWRKRCHFIALNDAMAMDLQKEGINPQRIQVIPNGISMPSRSADVARPDGYVLGVANFSQGGLRKGIDVLIRAWKTVCREFPGIKLVLAGGGETHPWIQMAKELKCEKNIRFPGYIHPPDELYRNACLFVLASRGEGVSNALLEAQSWGLPAVVSDIPGNRTVIDHGKNGLLVEPENPEALAESILFLLRSEKERKEMSQRAIEKIHSTFEIDTVARQLIELYAAFDR